VYQASRPGISDLPRLVILGMCIVHICRKLLQTGGAVVSGSLVILAGVNPSRKVLLLAMAKRRRHSDKESSYCVHKDSTEAMRYKCGHAHLRGGYLTKCPFCHREFSEEELEEHKGLCARNAFPRDRSGLTRQQRRASASSASSALTPLPDTPVTTRCERCGKLLPLSEFCQHAQSCRGKRGKAF